MSKTYSPPSDETLKYKCIRFVPTNCFSPNHWAVKSMVFPFEGFDTKSEYDAICKASLANKIAEALERTKMLKDANVLIPATLRLLGFKD